MIDDLGAWFDDLDRVAVPDGDLGWVVREGRARRRRRVAGRIASLSTVALMVAAAAWIVAGQNGRPVPADGADHPRLGSRFVPVDMEGASPPPELAAGWEREQARAVTVAFHALLDRKPHRLFAYEGVRRAGDAWVAEFMDVTEAAALERSLSRMVDDLAAKTEALRTQRGQLANAADRLVPGLEEATGERADELREQRDMLRRTQQQLRARITEAEAQLAELEENRDQVGESVGTSPVSLTVTEGNGLVVVEESSAEGVAGYAEAVDDVDAWGNDYFAATFDRFDRDTVRITVRTFWTGPLHAPYEERCRPEVTSMRGDVVLLRPWPDFPPGVPELWDESPATEDARDGGAISFGVHYEGDADDLRLRMLCQWRPRQ